MTVLRSPLRPVLRSPLYSPLVGKWGGAFSPSDLFQSGDIFLWYDPSDLSTMFKDTAGTQPVTADGQAVALHLDKGSWAGKTLTQVRAAATELFGTGAVGVTGSATAATYATGTGVATATRVDASNQSYVSIAVTSGRYYELDIENTGGSGLVGVRPLSLGSAFVTINPLIRSTLFVRATDAAFRICAAQDAQTVNFVVHSVKEIPGYHRVQATGTAMPKYKTDGTLHWLLYDGTDDGHATGTITWGTDEVAICTGVTKSSDAAIGVLAELSTSATTNNGAFGVFAPVSVADNYRFSVRGTALSSNLRSGFAAPHTAVLTAQADISADVNTFRISESETSVTDDQGTGNFGSYAMYFGRRAGSSLPFNGREYQTVIRSRLLSAAELASLETFIAGKTGVML